MKKIDRIMKKNYKRYLAQERKEFLDLAHKVCEKVAEEWKERCLFEKTVQPKIINNILFLPNEEAKQYDCYVKGYFLPKFVGALGYDSPVPLEVFAKMLYDNNEELKTSYGESTDDKNERSS